MSSSKTKSADSAAGRPHNVSLLQNIAPGEVSVPIKPGTFKQINSSNVQISSRSTDVTGLPAKCSDSALVRNDHGSYSKSIGFQQSISTSSTAFPASKPINVSAGQHSTSATSLLVVPSDAAATKKRNFQQTSDCTHKVQISLSSSNLTPPSLEVIATNAHSSKCSLVPGTVSSDPISNLSSPLSSNNWDPFSNGDCITVTCRKNHAILDRKKFGSGQRGKCILHEETWMTPSQFENACGLSTSRDWKRSIRYGSYTIQKLVCAGFLKPHSVVCACAVCCDDETVNCPVRLFQPYKRRKRNVNSSIVTSDDFGIVKAGLLKSEDLARHRPTGVSKQDAIKSSTIDLFGDRIHSSLDYEPSSGRECDVLQWIAEVQSAEERKWSRLEEVSNNLLEQARCLKVAIVEARSESEKQRSTMMQKLVELFQKQTAPADAALSDQTTSLSAPICDSAGWSTCDLIADFTASQAVGPKEQKPLIKVEVATTHKCCDACGNLARSECTGCHRATYCSTACQEKDWLNGHSKICPLDCGDERLEDDGWTVSWS